MSMIERQSMMSLMSLVGVRSTLSLGVEAVQLRREIMSNSELEVGVPKPLNALDTSKNMLSSATSMKLETRLKTRLKSRAE